MRNKKLFKSAVLITTVMLSVSGCAGGCSNQAEPVNAEPTETVSEVDTEESLESMESMESTEPAPSPTVESTEEPVEESSSNEESEIDTSQEEESSEEESLESEETEPDLGYTIIPMDDTTVYAISKCNIRKGPSTEYDIVGSLSYAQEITVNGRVEDGDKVWYVIKTDNSEDIQMVSGSLLSSTKPVQQQNTGGSTGNSTGSDTGGSTGGGSTDGGGGSSQQPSGGGESSNVPGTTGFGGRPITSGDGSGAGYIDLQ